MKILIWAERISLIVLILFGFFGFTILSTFVHEMSHVEDLKEIAKDGEICFLYLSGTSDFNLKEFIKEPMGYYSFRIDKKDSESYQEIKEYTEKKAILSELPITFLFVVCVGLVISKFFTKEGVKNNAWTIIKSQRIELKTK